MMLKPPLYVYFRALSFGLSTLGSRLWALDRLHPTPAAVYCRGTGKECGSEALGGVEKANGVRLRQSAAGALVPG